MSIKKGNIANALHSVAPDHVVATADEVFDETQNKYQSKINYGINEDISNIGANIGYYECDTLAGTAAKAITVAHYVLFAGGSIKVKFANMNTADNATLDINSQGAKALYYQGERASASNTWEAGETVEVYYDGTSYYANNVAGGSGSGDGALDVSAKYPTSGVEGGNTYTLEGALAVLNTNLPASKKKGGMSIKFVQSSDNKYVQYRLMATDWSTVVANWQGVDDEPTVGSENLVKSEGVYGAIQLIKEEIDGVVPETIDGTFYDGFIIGTTVGETISLTRSSSTTTESAIIDIVNKNVSLFKTNAYKAKNSGRSRIYLCASNDLKILSVADVSKTEEEPVPVPTGTRYIVVNNTKGSVANPYVQAIVPGTSGLSDRVNALEADVDDLESDVDNLKDSVEDITNDISQLDADVNGVPFVVVASGTFESGFIIGTSVGETISLTRDSSTKIESAIIDIDGLNAGTFKTNAYKLHNSGRSRIYICADSSLKILIVGSDINTTNEVPVDIPDGTKYIIINNTIEDQSNPYVDVYSNGSIGLTERVSNLEEEIEEIEHNIEENKKGCLTAYANNLTNDLTLGDTNENTNDGFPLSNKFGDKYSFGCRVTTFDGIKICRGYAADYAKWFEIDNTNIILKSGESGTISETVAHGLTIERMLNVNININSSGVARVVMQTLDGNYVHDFTGWGRGVSGVLHVKNNGSVLTNCILSATNNYINSKIWIFGASFESISNSRWTGQIIDVMGYSNFLINGYPGRSGAVALKDFKRALNLGTPQYLFFPSSNDVSFSVYKSNIEAVLSICQDNGITLVVSRKADNETTDFSEYRTYIDETLVPLGVRYVNYYLALHDPDKTWSSGNADWYDGFMGSDGKHPTVLGARALAQQFCLDFPEIMQFADDRILGSSGNFVGFNTNGYMVDSGSKPSDFMPAQ